MLHVYSRQRRASTWQPGNQSSLGTSAGLLCATQMGSMSGEEGVEVQTPSLRTDCAFCVVLFFHQGAPYHFCSMSMENSILSSSHAAAVFLKEKTQEVKV